MAEIAFRIGGAERTVRVERLVIAGWTGRDRAAVEHHIAELAAIGVKPPRAVPCFYRVGAELLTTAPAIEVKIISLPCLRREEAASVEFPDAAWQRRHPRDLSTRP